VGWRFTFDYGTQAFLTCLQVQVVRPAFVNQLIPPLDPQPLDAPFLFLGTGRFLLPPARVKLGYGFVCAHLPWPGQDGLALSTYVVPILLGPKIAWNFGVKVRYPSR